MTDEIKRLPPGAREPTSFAALSGIDDEVEGRFGAVPTARMADVLPVTNLWPEEVTEPPLGYEVDAQVPVGEAHEIEKAAELLARPKPRIIREDLAALNDFDLRKTRELWQGRVSDGGRGAAAAMEEVGAIEAELAARAKPEIVSE